MSDLLPNLPFYTFSPEDIIRITIAKKRGWHLKVYDDASYMEWQREGEASQQVMFGLYKNSDCDDIIPDYPGDLNAMAEVEKDMNDYEAERYPHFLAEQVKAAGGCVNGLTRIWLASAKQRAEAYLKMCEFIDSLKSTLPESV